MTRAVIRGLVEKSLAHGGAVRLARRRVGGRALILSYHNIVSDAMDPCGDRSLHLPRSRFGRQLDLLARDHEVVPLEDVLDPARGRRPRVAITFDDAYRGALEHGLPELERRGIPATIFVSPGRLGAADFWWDAVAGGDDSSLPGRVRDHALGELAGDDVAVREWAAAGLAMRRHGGFAADVGPATEDLLQEAASRPGVTLGAHGWSHRNLTRLEPAELGMELERPLDWLQERFDRVIPWLAYPYGLHSPAVVAAARAAGYRGAVRVGGGWLPSRSANPHLLPRMNVPAGLSPEGFLLRISGLFVH